MLIHEVEQLLVVFELSVPLVAVVVTEVVTEWNKNDVSIVQRCLLPVLIQKSFRSTKQQAK